MARALECPACGEKHRLDTLPNAPTFRCQRCGQVLKIPDVGANGSSPPSSRRSSSPAPPPRRAVTATAGPAAAGAKAGAAPVVPPKRRRPSGDPAAPAPAGVTSAATRGAVGVSATVAAVEGPPQTRADRRAQASAEPRAPRGPKGPKATGEPPKKVSWYWRLLAWIVAVPLGFVITAWPAYKLNLIRKDDVLNIFVGSGTGRYARLAIGTAVWALVTALLVQLFVEGGRWYMARRRARPSRPKPTSKPATAR